MLAPLMTGMPIVLMIGMAMVGVGRVAQKAV